MLDEINGPSVEVVAPSEHLNAARQEPCAASIEITDERCAAIPGTEMKARSDFSRYGGRG